MIESGFGLNDCPLKTFSSWYEQALKIEQNAGAFSLATIDEKGRPNSRQLLLKGCSNEGFLFFSNYDSVKAKEIENNNYVAMNFYWHDSEKQVRIRGTIEKCDLETSKEYFISRGFESKIASSISKQSAPIKDRATLEKEFYDFKNSLTDDNVPYPENWGGYIVKPFEMTFFIYGEFRLNDRFNFLREGETWEVQRLYP